MTFVAHRIRGAYIGRIMNYAIAVIDIGMTNKKVAIYDDTLTQLEATYKNFEPLYIENTSTKETIAVHDLKGMERYFIEEIKKFSQKYPIKAIAVSTHGATFVCIDKNGSVCTPCIIYTYEAGNAFHNEFYATCGNRYDLQKTTYTPPFSALINPAKGVYYLQKYFPDDFAKTACILNFPQYWGFVFTGITGAEPTYCGCHTYLWNHKKSDWSQVADTLKIRHLLPTNYKNTYEQLGTLKQDLAQKMTLSPDVIVTMGIHDSNASLLPYLTNQIAQNAKQTGTPNIQDDFSKEFTEDFILNSTGTWCVCMHSQNSLEFNDDDIGKIVFFNQSAFRKPVKTSIFLGGMELDTYVKLFQQHTKTDLFPSSTIECVNKILLDKTCFLLPEIISGSGQFPHAKAGIWEDSVFFSFEDMQNGKKNPKILGNEQEFFALLDISLVIQTEIALKRAGLGEKTKIFTEGGFRKNKLYNTLLSSILPKNSVFLTSMAEATAFGAALTAKIACENAKSDTIFIDANIEYVPVEKVSVFQYEKYKKQWLSLAEK